MTEDGVNKRNDACVEVPHLQISYATVRGRLQELKLGLIGIPRIL